MKYVLALACAVIAQAISVAALDMSMKDAGGNLFWQAIGMLMVLINDRK